MNMQKSTDLDDVAEVIGFTATMHLMFWFGSTHGAWLHVPQGWTAEHPITQAIGEKASRALVKYYGGTQVCITDTLVDARIARYRTLIAMDQGGSGPEAIAEAVGLGVRRVQQLLRALKAARLTSVLGKNANSTPGGVSRENANSTPGGVL